MESMTKQEKLVLRRALIEEERTRVDLPNPHVPAAKIYLYPAAFKDMDQVKGIYNHYVREASIVYDLESVDELYWRNRHKRPKTRGLRRCCPLGRKALPPPGIHHPQEAGRMLSDSLWLPTSGEKRHCSPAP